MISQPQNLVVQIIGRQFHVRFGLEAAEIVAVFAELFLPFPLATPAGHDEQAVFVRQIVKPLAAAPNAFQRMVFRFIALVY